MHLIQLLLPLHNNEGRGFPPNYFNQVREDLTERFGGVTAFIRAPVFGKRVPTKSIGTRWSSLKCSLSSLTAIGGLSIANNCKINFVKTNSDLGIEHYQVVISSSNALSLSFISKGAVHDYRSPLIQL